jgi:transposase
MASQKQAVMDLVEQHRDEGRRIGEVLSSVGVARSSYYRWRKGRGKPKERRQSSNQITEEERRLIEEVKEAHPQYRHRRIQGVLQSGGVYLSASAIYGHLRQKGWVEDYERRAAPWKDPRYEIWQRNLMWGCDWTKLLVGG